jgi:peptidoglycan/xylan/chitin deacetylase (PgdA/CDA1 family)
MARPDSRVGGTELPGALVVSLDFELAWGNPAKSRQSERHQARLRGARNAIPRILDLFERYGIRATWAVVGFLLTESGDDLLSLSPSLKPEYEDSALDPYGEPVGSSEDRDPLHLAASLVRLIASTPGQEVASHTFSHYYALERGQDVAAFREDLVSARRVFARESIASESLVFPRNQVNTDYLATARELGFIAYRGQGSGWIDRRCRAVAPKRRYRLLRLADSYLPLQDCLIDWPVASSGAAPTNIPASRFLRAHSDRLRWAEPLKLKRILHELNDAALQRNIYHLWWHPSDFGLNTSENLAGLERILDRFCQLHESAGMRSLTISDAAFLVQQA